jgi:DNA polymerase-3 subunit gamma/tau
MARALSQPQSLAEPAAEPRIALQSLDDVMQLIESKRDIALKLDLAKFARPVSFRPGAIAFEPAPGAPSNLAQRLAARLKEWTGQTWLVAAEGGGGGESLYEREQRERLAARREIEADPFVRSVMQAFPGAEIVAVRQLAAPAGTSDMGGAGDDDDQD